MHQLLRHIQHVSCDHGLCPRSFRRPGGTALLTAFGSFQDFEIRSHSQDDLGLPGDIAPKRSGTGVGS